MKPFGLLQALRENEIKNGDKTPWWLKVFTALFFVGVIASLLYVEYKL